MEPYWLLSNGYYIYVDNRVPLFLSNSDSDDNIFQLIAKKEFPYIKYQKNALNFAICKLRDLYRAQQHAIQHFLGKPSTLPDERLVTHTVWSIEGSDPNKILNFAQDIAKHGLVGQLRIDSTWEECTGSLRPKYDLLTFENLISELKKLNFTVALAIDAFVGYKCNDTYDDGIRNNYFVKNDENDTSVNGEPDGNRFIDLTNPDARNWYLKRLRHLRETYGIDSFKLDNVISSYLPKPPIYHTMAEDHPETIVKEAAKVLASLGSSMQTSVARNIQQYGLFVNPVPWYWHDYNIGLSSIIPTLLYLNIVGYSFVTNKIGASVWNDVKFKNRELYIRWTQLNVFMPTMEFAIAPWDFDDEV